MKSNTARWIATLLGVAILASACASGEITILEADPGSAPATTQIVESVPSTTAIPARTTTVVSTMSTSTVQIVPGLPEGDLPEPEPTAVWVDRADAVRIEIESIFVDEDIERVRLDSNGEFNPDGSDIGWIFEHGRGLCTVSDIDDCPTGVGFCEIGLVWAIGHSNRSGGLTELVVNPDDPADSGSGSPGIQTGDIIEITLEDDTGCKYQVVEFGPITTGTPVESVAGSPAVGWPKLQFDSQSDHPSWEWPNPEGVGTLYLSTSGGGKPVNGHRLDLDVIRTVMIED